MKLKVKDLMQTKIKSLTPDTGALDALKYIMKLKISGLPVIDGKGYLRGMFTEKDVLKTILPSYLKDVGSFVYSEDPKSEIKKMASIGKYKVKDLMRTDVVTVEPETSLAEVSKIMLLKAARRIVVVDAKKKAVGIIARCDVVKAFGKEAGLL